MRINFKRIEIHNFMCFEDEVFEFNKHNGLTLICGKNNDIPGSKNGTGKSTCWSALTYALYGNLPNKVKNENIYNRFSGSKELRVVLWLDVDDKSYKIISTTNKYGGPACQLLDITEDDNEIDLTKSTIIETRKFIENEILHCDMSLFLRTILLTSDQTYNFFKLSKYDKKEFIEKLFDISIFGDMYNEIHRDILNLDKNVNSIENKLLVLNKNKSEYSTKMHDYSEKHSQKIKELVDTLKSLKDQLKKLKQHAISKNEAEVSKLEDQHNELDELKAKCNLAMNKINETVSELQIVNHKLKSSREVSKNAIEKHSQILTKLCDDCKEIFKDYYNLNKYQTEINDIDLKIKANSLKISGLEEKGEKITSKIKEIDDKMDKISERLKNLTAEYNKSTQDIAVLNSRISSVTKDIESAKNEKNPYESLVDSNNKQLEDEEKKLKSITEEYCYLEMAQSIVSQETIRKFIIKDLISILNNRIKYYLMKMGAKFNVTFDENMDYEFETDGRKCEYNSFSSGERMRINISTSFAFRDFLSTRSNFTANILVLDELIDSNLDSMSVENTIGIVKEFVKNYDQRVYVISHRKEINNSLFNNIIQIVKTNNVSKITYL